MDAPTCAPSILDTALAAVEVGATDAEILELFALVGVAA